MTQPRFIDVCECEPLEQAVLFIVLTDSRMRGVTARKIAERIGCLDVKVPAKDLLVAIKQLCERGALVRTGYKKDWAIDADWRNCQGKRKFLQTAYRVRHEGE